MLCPTPRYSFPAGCNLKDRLSIKPVGCVAAAVAVLATLAFWPCTRNGFTHWDDNVYLEGAAQHGVGWAWTTTRVYYHPLTWMSPMLDLKLWGQNPAAHHATNIALHALNCGLVVWLAWLLTQQLPLAAAVGVVF